MKIFAIRDEFDKKQKDLAFLFYYEKDRRFYIELPRDCDPWEVPLILSSFAEKGIYTIGSDWSRIWVQQRIVPTDRQNLGQILKDNKLKEYDEYKLLMLAMGRCEQDDYYLSPLKEEELPKEIRERLQNSIEAVVPLEDHKVLVFFCNGTAKKFDAKEQAERLAVYYERFQTEELFHSVKVSTGGYGIDWTSEVGASKEEACRDGEPLSISLDDLRSFVEHSVVNSQEAADLLDCSRQNIDDLVKRGKLKPLKKSEKSMLFLRDEVLKRKWD